MRVPVVWSWLAVRLRAVRLLWSAVPALLTCSAAMAQAGATIDQVDQAVREGRLLQAQEMMVPLLRDHPDDARIHYVDAELLARLGQTAQAREELGTTERLAPGLPFARPDSLEALRHALFASAEDARGISPVRLAREPGASPARSGYWGVVAALLGGGALAWTLSRLGRPSAAPMPPPPASSARGSASGSWPPAAWPQTPASDTTGPTQPMDGARHGHDPSLRPSGAGVAGVNADS